VIVFFLTSIALTYFSVSRHAKPVAVPAPKEAPVGQVPAPSAPAGGKAQDIPN
jgi:hypothetical protein